MMIYIRIDKSHFISCFGRSVHKNSIRVYRGIPHKDIEEISESRFTSNLLPGDQPRIYISLDVP
jgi:hypothetical protein